MNFHLVDPVEVLGKYLVVYYKLLVNLLEVGYFLLEIFTVDFKLLLSPYENSAIVL